MLSSPPPQSSRHPRVLVIDDDEIALQSISDLLEEAGYHVFGMLSPIGATQFIASNGIEAAVIDLNMPQMSGDRLVALIRSWDRMRELPVVLISGTAMETLQAVAAELPDVPLVTKSSMRRVLVPVVARALSARHERGGDPRDTQRIRRDDKP